MSPASSPPAEPSVGPVEIGSWLGEAEGGGWRVGPPIGDVSSRKYFRAERADGASVIVAWYPAEAADAYTRYQESTRLLTAAGIRTPEVIAVDAGRRFMALEDVGDRRLFDLGGGEDAERLFVDALQIAARVAALPAAGVGALNPPLDGDLMRRELEQTWRLFLARHLGGAGAEPTREALFELCDEIARRPRDPCHRDLMARNLMVVGEGRDAELVVLDHQDLRMGPRGYDVASLLHDSCRLDAAAVRRLEATVPELCESEGYAAMVVQRALKIVGTFHAFAERGAPRYLPMVPGVLRDALDHLDRLDGRHDLARRLRERLPL